MRRTACILFLALSLLAGCTGGAPASPPSLPLGKGGGEPLRVAVQSYYCSAMVGLIVDNGWDTAAGIPFELTVYPGGTEVNRAFAEEGWDVAVTGGAFIYALADHEASLIATQVDGTRGNNIFVRKDSPVLAVRGFNPTCPRVCGDPASVRGLTILHNAGTSSHYITSNWLESIGVREDEVTTVSADFHEVYTRFLEGEGDAAAMTPPWSLSDKSGDWVSAASLEDLDAKLLEATLCANSALETRREDILRFLQLLFQANDRLNGDAALKKQVVLDWYRRCGRPVSDREVTAEIGDKPLIGSAQALEMDMGEYLLDYAGFYTKIGAISPEQLDRVLDAQRQDLLEEALAPLLQADE